MLVDFDTPPTFRNPVAEVAEPGVIFRFRGRGWGLSTGS
jgi:hypothetical protein